MMTGTCSSSPSFKLTLDSAPVPVSEPATLVATVGMGDPCLPLAQAAAAAEDSGDDNAIMLLVSVGAAVLVMCCVVSASSDRSCSESCSRLVSAYALGANDSDPCGPAVLFESTR